MELPSLVTGSVMQKLEGPEHVVFTPLAIIYKLLRFIITNVFLTGSNLTSKITSSMLWIFSIFPSNTSFSTKIIIVNFIVLTIMQETCNTYILAGVDGSSNVGSRRNESFATDHQHTEKTDVYTGPYAPWNDFSMEFNHWVYTLSAVCGFWLILMIFLAIFCGPHQFSCHLCEQKIPRRLWQSGEHRAPCARDHERFLYELPDATQKSAKCPECSRTLKVWPQGLGPVPFKCHQGRNCEVSLFRKLRLKRIKEKAKKKIGNKSAGKVFSTDMGNEDEDLEQYAAGELPPPQMTDVENNGQSRLCCFRCGYDMCDKCADFLDNLSYKREQLKETKKLSVIAEKVMLKENGGHAVTSGAHGKWSSETYRNDKRSTANSTGGGAWVMDGVQLKTISKTVQQMQNDTRHSGNRVNGNIHNGIAVQPVQQ